MYTIARSALVMHSAEEMYALVNDIDSYAQFLPWCGASEVLQRGEREMVARVDIAFRGVAKSFTTRNHLTPFEQTRMTLVDGPFSELSGAWTFTALRPGACRISLDLRFDFSNPLAARLVGPVFRHIADSLVDSFVKRAAQLHPRGPQPGLISAEVVYALPQRQVVEQLQLRPPATIEQAIRASKLLRRFPQLDLAHTAVGVFGVERPLDWALADRDRVEIYRPLVMSPTEARRRRAAAE